MTYIRPDGEKPVLNEKVFQLFPEPVRLEITAETKAQKEAPGAFLPYTVPVETKPETAEKQSPAEKNLKDGIRLFRMRRWENALQEFLLVKSDEFNEEKRMELAYYMGLCYTKLERYDEALPRLEQVVIYGENFLRAYQCRMTLAYIYIITGKAEMAEAELNRLQKSGFESAPLYNTLAYSAYMQKRFHDAVELYEKALDLERDNATALNSMGFILADTGMDREKGLKLCRKAVEHRPKSATYLDSLGWAHYKNGNFSEARNWLSRAMDIAPKEKEIKEHFRTVTGGRL